MKIILVYMKSYDQPATLRPKKIIHSGDAASLASSPSKASTCSGLTNVDDTTTPSSPCLLALRGGGHTTQPGTIALLACLSKHPLRCPASEVHASKPRFVQSVTVNVSYQSGDCPCP